MPAVSAEWWPLPPGTASRSRICQLAYPSQHWDHSCSDSMIVALKAARYAGETTPDHVTMIRLRLLFRCCSPGLVPSEFESITSLRRYAPPILEYCVASPRNPP